MGVESSSHFPRGFLSEHMLSVLLSALPLPGEISPAENSHAFASV